MLIRATGVTAAICLGAMVSATPSLAVPITYNLTMTQTSGNLVPNNSVAGTGSFTIEGPVGAGVVTFSEVTGGGLLALSFVINNRTFDLADTPPNTQFPATVSFLNGNLFTFGYNAKDDPQNLFSLQVSTQYLYFANTAQNTPPFAQSIGTITATLAPPPPVLPEPSTLGLIGLGLLGLGAMRRQRRYS